jgi:hypothetical protein
VFIKLDSILGRIPAQVWAQFDAEIDQQVYGRIERQGRKYRTQV